MLSRNAKCPCGSGRKYKKCCLLKVEVKQEPQEVKFSEVPREEVTEAQAKEVVERMRQGLMGMNVLEPLKTRQSFWERIKGKIKS